MFNRIKTDYWTAYNQGYSDGKRDGIAKEKDEVDYLIRTKNQALNHVKKFEQVIADLENKDLKNGYGLVLCNGELMYVKVNYIKDRYAHADNYKYAQRIRTIQLEEIPCDEFKVEENS